MSAVRYAGQRSRRVELKADCVVLLDRIVAMCSDSLTDRHHREIAEMRMRLAPPPGVRAPIVVTGYTRDKRS